MPVQRPLRGIACMLAAAALFVGMDSLAKYLGDNYSPVQLAWSRYSVHLIVLVVLLAFMAVSYTHLTLPTKRIV